MGKSVQLYLLTSCQCLRWIWYRKNNP